MKFKAALTSTSQEDLTELTAKQKTVTMTWMIKFVLSTWVGGCGRAFIYMIARWLDILFGHLFVLYADIWSTVSW